MVSANGQCHELAGRMPALAIVCGFAMPDVPASPFVAVIGGGPAGLMAADVLSGMGHAVTVFDAKPSLGRKFLLAGVGGMNITHSEPMAPFLSRYGQSRDWVASWLAAFGPEALRAWIHEQGIHTFVGSSGRVFPTDMKAAPLLRAWLHRLREQGVEFRVRHRWQGWAADGSLHFETAAGSCLVRPVATVLALGGGSWARLGSDGAWVPRLRDRQVDVAPLRPANCGFDVGWSEHFRERFAGQPLKSVAAVFTDAQGHEQRQNGECVVTADGIEGGLVYAQSARLRDACEAEGSATLLLDLVPGRSLEAVQQALEKPRGSRSLANHLRSQLRLEGAKAGLLRECLPAEVFSNMAALARGIKALPVRLQGPRPLDEAISSAGGVPAHELDAGLMLRKSPGVFCTGEMLDWEAPTGGYLLTACFASGRVAGHGVANWLAAGHHDVANDITALHTKKEGIDE